MKKQFDIRMRKLLGDVIVANLNYLVRFASIRIGNKSDAEDVVHEAVKRILEADLSNINPDSIKMYLFRIVNNLCKDFYLTGGNVRPLSVIDDEITDSSIDDILDLEMENMPRYNTFEAFANYSP